MSPDRFALCLEIEREPLPPGTAFRKNIQMQLWLSGHESPSFHARRRVRRAAEKKKKTLFWFCAALLSRGKEFHIPVDFPVPGKTSPHLPRYTAEALEHFQ